MPPSIVNLLELSTPSARNSPVQAYAKLEFGAYSFYVQSLSVTLGRKASDSDPVDIHLGTSKSISRTHARLQYSFARHCFEICVVGRNGLFVDDVFYDQGNVVPLEDRAQIQIGEIKFNFLLPQQVQEEGEEELDPEDQDTSDLSSPPSSTSPTPAPEDNGPPPEKPDIPYATLIAQSLLSHPRRRQTLQEIYTWIQDHHPYYRGRNKSWQSSIRHNLISSPAFVHYPRPGEDPTDRKKGKRGKDEWGISPEYEGLIGDLSAKEADVEKLSTKLNKKKAAAPPKVKPPKKTAPPVPAKESQSTPTPAATTEDKSKLEALVKNIQGKGVDIGALMQEALAKMKGLPIAKPPIPPVQPPAKRMKPNVPAKPSSESPLPPKLNFSPPPPPTPQSSSTSQSQVPLAMPQPLPYTVPIPPLGSTNNVQVKKESTPIAAPAPSITPAIPVSVVKPKPSTSPVPLPIASSASPAETVDERPSVSEASPEVSEASPEVNGIKEEATLPVKTEPKAVETAISRRSTRGQKRGLEL